MTDIRVTLDYARTHVGCHVDLCHYHGPVEHGTIAGCDSRCVFVRYDTDVGHIVATGADLLTLTDDLEVAA